MKKINKKSSIPIYYQLKGIILEMIENEDVKPGDVIPTERELCEFHDISRMTVRMAIMELVNEGVLYREQGKGTYVAQQKTKHELTKLTSFSDEMERSGHQVDTSLLSFQKMTSTKQIATALQIEIGADVLEIIRLRIIDDEPYALETVWLDANKYKEVTESQLNRQSLADILEHNYGVQTHHAKQTIEPVYLNDEEKKLFQITGESLGLLFYQTSYLETNEVIEYSRSVYRIDKHKFEIHTE